VILTFLKERHIPEQSKIQRISFSAVEEGFCFVNFAEMGLHTGVIHRPTGKVYLFSEIGDMDEIGEADLDWDECIELPHKNELDLGRDLVFEFVDQHLPGDEAEVDRIFRRRGAYGRYKDRLEAKGKLEQWYDFENQREERALRKWCAENEIVLTD